MKRLLNTLFVFAFGTAMTLSAVAQENKTSTPEDKNPNGTANKFKVALKDFARKGPLGLQGLHGKAQAPVWYRNLKIKVLE